MSSVSYLVFVPAAGDVIDYESGEVFVAHVMTLSSRALGGGSSARATVGLLDLDPGATPPAVSRPFLRSVQGSGRKLLIADFSRDLLDGSPIAWCCACRAHRRNRTDADAATVALCLSQLARSPRSSACGRMRQPRSGRPRADRPRGHDLPLTRRRDVRRRTRAARRVL